ncbi:hypothetical protein [Roseobacter sinensis]|uniref:hypothetical protein n=1 Tax=Roseobacter sinensis TaxID=2931391 RepID=UPI0021E94317|nr:hypothetical protein [Roseobacter sp. WL0113]
MEGGIERILDVRVRSGQQGAVQRLISETVRAGELDQPGSLRYDNTSSNDHLRGAAVNRHASKTALTAPADTARALLAAQWFSALLLVERAVYRSADTRGRAPLAGFGAAEIAQLGGFRRA